MSKVKRGKGFSSNYRKKHYAIEFLDYETWKAKFSSEDKATDFFSDFQKEEDLKSSFNQLFWEGNIIIEDQKYIFTVLAHLEKEGVNFEILLPSSDDKKHQQVINKSFKKINQEILEVIKPQFQQFLSESMRKIEAENYDDDEDYDEDDDYYYDDDEEGDDYEEDEKDYHDYEKYFNDPDLEETDLELLLTSDFWVYRPLAENDWTRGKLEHLAQGIAVKQLKKKNHLHHLTDHQLMIAIVALQNKKTESEVYQCLEEIKQKDDGKFNDCFTDDLYQAISNYLTARQELFEEIMEKCLSKGIYRFNYFTSDGEIVDYESIEFRPQSSLIHSKTFTAEDVCLY